MKPSFSKFSNILKSETSITPEEVDFLHSFIFQNVIAKTFTPNDLAIASKTIFRPRAVSILSNLSSFGVIEQDEYLCPECSAELLVAEIENSQCPECESNISLAETVSYTIPGLLEETKSKRILESEITQRKADIIADVWEREGYITYLLTDLVNSQNIQKLSDSSYTYFLKALRDVWKYKILSQAKKPYLFLGEIGDAYKIAFVDPNDAMNCIKLFAMELENNEIFHSFHSIKKRIDQFPKFTAVLQKLSKPVNDRGEAISPRDVITTTLNGTLDFNTMKLTDLFRLDSASSVHYSFYNKFDISFWIFSNVLSDLFEAPVYNEILDNTTQIEALKNKAIVSSAEAALFLFKGKKSFISVYPAFYDADISLDKNFFVDLEDFVTKSNLPDTRMKRKRRVFLGLRGGPLRKIDSAKKEVPKKKTTKKKK